jgi:hypothetical protein
MTRYDKSGGKYHIGGGSHQQLMGTRAQVWHGTAYKTSGGLTKKNLMKNKSGRIVSKSKHSTANRENRLVKSGYGTKKGTFGFVKLDGSKTRSRGRKTRGRKTRGGAPYGSGFSPASANIDGQGVTNYGSGSNDVQFEAGMAGGGKGYGWLGNGVDGQGVTNYGSGSNDVQFQAGMSGGKRRRRRRM